VLPTSSERSVSSHHGVCPVRQRELKHATTTAASTTAVGTNATEYRYDYAANCASDTQQHSDTTTGSSFNDYREQDNRLLCIRILNVDSDEVYTVIYYYDHYCTDEYSVYSRS
jgi:hypothetical protein